ncbi:MAG TPA: glycosyltransferase family 4 protein [Longimicrobium sp.]|nr:glycosyltransferase family 4 protein [Longimicrobium sp.]
MSAPAAAGIVAAAALTAGMLTWGVLHYAVARNVVAVANARSSHQGKTPVGGGLAIVLVAVAFELGLGWTGRLSPEVALALAGGGAAVAAIGWVDDHAGGRGGVHALARAAVHFAAAAWALWCLGGLPELRTGTGSVPLGLVGTVLAAFGIVWSTNLYNFMDGIDGLAAGEAVSAGLVGAVLLLATGEPGLAGTALAVAGASLGFLKWNWSQARIFMGDVGSYFLGFTFAVLAVASERAGAVPLLAWMVLLGVFVFDATATLVRRVRRGERFHQAHRSHAYQRAAIAVRSHARVSGAVQALNLVLALLAAAGTLRPGWLPWTVGAAVVILAALYLVIERRWPMHAGTGPDVPGSTLAPRAR